MMSRGVKDEYSYNVESNHMRRASQVDSMPVDDNNTFRGSSNFAKKDDQGTAAAAYSRDRVYTGRVENLRSMGNDLMRPVS